MRSTNYEVTDYAALAEHLFGSAAANDLSSIKLQLAGHMYDSGEYGSPAQRKRKLERTQNAAAKLRNYLAGLDPTTRVSLFGGVKFGDHSGESSAMANSAAAASNSDALRKLVIFETLLNEVPSGTRPLPNPVMPKVDWVAICEQWLKSAAPAEKLCDIIFEVARQAHDSAEYGSPSQRKLKLTRMQSAKVKLRKHLTGLDPITHVRLFGGEFDTLSGDNSSTAGAAAVASNSNAIGKRVIFETLLNESVSRANNLIDHTPRQSAGAASLPDAVLFGVECLGSFWKKYRDERPTSGQNGKSFGWLAKFVLCGPPVNAPPEQVHTALRRYFQREPD